ncbi:hypothetical protein NQZ68_015891 [Dissostichus eleginoides]|nr:hypothetical protein NQZ68_015891 [Dissostichus eleginoides]
MKALAGDCSSDKKQQPVIVPAGSEMVLWAHIPENIDGEMEVTVRAIQETAEECTSGGAPHCADLPKS